MERRILVLALVAGCGGAGQRTGEQRVADGVSERPLADGGAGEAGRFGAREPAEAATCGERTPCRVAGGQPAGKDAAGHDLDVIELDLGKDADIGCDRSERWLVVWRDAHTIESAQLLVTICNDGYGARGIGEDLVEVSENRFKHARSGGSNWSWGTSAVVQLSPLAVLEESHDYSWIVSNNLEVWTWSWVDFRGRIAGNAPTCGPDGEPYDMDEGLDTEMHDYEYQLIPMLALPEDFVKLGWRTTALGSCAARDSYVTYGEPGADGDARLAVVMGADRALYIEITDDRWMLGGKKWLTNDHLELWLAPEAASYANQCSDEKDMSKAVQWAIPLDGGALIPAFGKPGPAAQPPVVVVMTPSAGQPARVKLELPAGHQAVTVVFSDSDDGKKQERLLATSKLTYGKVWTLGRAGHEIKPELAVCEVKDGVLVPRITMKFEKDRAVVDGY